MENADAIVVQEPRSNAKKMWDKVVEKSGTISKIKFKATPAMLKIASVFAPEVGPICWGLAKYLKTKKVREMYDRSIDSRTALLKGDKDEALRNMEENFEMLGSDEGDEVIKGLEDNLNIIKSTGGK